MSLEFLWEKPEGHYTSFEVTFERPLQNDEVIIVDDLEVKFDKLYPDTEYTITIRTLRAWEEGDEEKYSKPVSLTVSTGTCQRLKGHNGRRP